MKTPEEWTSLFYTNKVKFLPDLIKQVQDEVLTDILNAVNVSVNEMVNKKQPSINPKCSKCRDTGWFFVPKFGGGGSEKKCDCESLK